jgi:hypothetical protein
MGRQIKVFGKTEKLALMKLILKMTVRQERQCTYKRNIKARSCNDFCCGKAISITYSECVPVALIMQHAKRMHRITL